AQYGGEPGLLAALQQSGITSVDAYRQTLYLNKLMTEAVKKAANFSEEDIKAYYDAWEPQITVQHILIAAKSDASDEEKATAKAKAEELIKQLKDGADFAELAKANSADTGTAAKGGQIGPFKRSDMVTEFSTAAYDLKNVGDITETPVQTQFGYHIIKLVSKEEKKPFDEMKEQMEKEMLDAKLKDSAYLHQTMVDLVKAADVKITDESLQNALKNFLQTADSETTTTVAK
ncbi:MAG: peptidylprolyl isomerase, partial [Streptococcus sp.]|nr:peptidylprolyl isomerase [Streptococcus sp.]